MAKDKEGNLIPSGDDIVGTGNDARLKMLQQINDGNDAAMIKEGGIADVHDDGSTSEFTAEPIDEALTDEEIAARELQRAADEANQHADETDEEREIREAAEAEAASAAAAVEAARIAAEKAALPKIKIKVNGVEREVTQDELIAMAAKGEGADEKFQEAAKLRKEAEELAKKQLDKPDQEAQRKLQEEAAAKALEEKRAMVRAIQMGTEVEAMAAIEKLFAKPVQPAFSAEDIAHTVDERITFKEAVDQFKNDFKDIVGDKVLMDIVLRRDKDLLAQGDARDYVERYTEIGNDVRAWRDEIVTNAKKAEVKPEDKDKKVVVDKQARKEAAPATPKGADQRAPKVVDEEDKDESASDVIAKIAAARGGPQWLRHG